MGQAIHDGVLCDYDISAPVVTEHHAYVCLADLLLKQAGRFRRVLAYCNRVAEAKKFQMVLEELGLAAWHINATTPRKKRMAAIEEFSGDLTKPVHVMVTVEVLGEGINIPNADTCMFVEPRNSYRSVIQAIGRVLRHHPCKTLAHIVLPAVAVPARVESEMEEGWSTAQHDDSGGAETGEVSGTVPLNAYEENASPNQAFPHLSVANKSKRSEGQSTGTRQEYPCRLTPPPSSCGCDLQEASTLKNPRGMPQVKTVAQRDCAVREVEEEPARREGLDDAAANVTGEASEERVRTKSLSRAQSSSSSTWSSSASSMSLPSLEPASSAPTVSSDRMARGRQDESGKLWQPGPLAQPWEVSEDPEIDQPQVPAYQGWSSPSMPSTIQQTIQKDTAAWEQHPLFMDRANSRMEQQSVRTSAAEAQPRGVPGSQIRRVQLKSNLAPSDPNNLYGSQLERFLSLLVQADSRLVGSNVRHRIELVDCRMTVEGQELDSLTGAVYRRLTAILCQSDPWDERLQSLEAFVEENGKLPRRKDLSGASYSEKSLGNWLNAQRARLRAGLLSDQQWQRLANSSLPLIRRRAQGWLANDQDGAFQRRCIELKSYMELNGELPRFTSKTPNSQSHRLALWLGSLRDRGGWNEPVRRAMLERLHPLVAELVAKWDARSTRIDLRAWQSVFRRLVNWVQAKGRLPRLSSTSSGKELYNWLYRNLRRLERLPQELVQDLHDSHPLIAAEVRAAQMRQLGRARLKLFAKVPLFQGCCWHLGEMFAKLLTQLRPGVQGDSALKHSCHFLMPPALVSTGFVFCRAQAALPAVRNWAHAAQTPPWPRLAGIQCLGVSRSRPAPGTMGCTQEMVVMSSRHVVTSCVCELAGRSALQQQLRRSLPQDPWMNFESCKRMS